MKMDHKNVFFFIFEIYQAALKIDILGSLQLIQG